MSILLCENICSELTAPASGYVPIWISHRGLLVSDQSGPLFPDWFFESILPVHHRCVSATLLNRGETHGGKGQGVWLLIKKLALICSFLLGRYKPSNPTAALNKIIQ